MLSQVKTKTIIQHPIDINSEKLISQCEQSIQELSRLKRDKSDEATNKRANLIGYLAKVLHTARSPELITAECVALSLCVLDILETHPELVGGTATAASILLDVNNYLLMTFNCEAMTRRIRNDTKKLLQIDPNYLPNQLPKHLSRPKKDETRKNFLKRRMKEHLDARRRNITLGLVESILKNEALKIEAIHFFGNGKAKKMEQMNELKPAEQEIYETYKFYNPDDPDEKKYLENIAYLDERERDAYRVFPHAGKLFCTEFNGQGIVPFKKVPVSTKQFSSHNKDNFASLVINARGEIFIGNHIESKFHHSAFMSGGDVLFAGEINIQDDGTIATITNYSGHYQPDLKSLYFCYEFLKDRGLDLSHCVFKEMDRGKMQEKVSKHAKLNPGFMKKLQQGDEKATNVAAKFTNDSFNTYLSTDLEGIFSKAGISAPKKE
ncbi:MAG: hypothetical protein ACD_46C00570G0004 [uncultured bacterium]|nr:MAG: hypothetical protein ACD_46C00570G0004 [uncultured bacterium]